MPHAEISATSMANGAAELLDEVARTKVTGEEEAFSHTDLVDIQANVDGARQVVTLLGPVLTTRAPDLRAALTSSLDELQTLLDGHRTSAGFPPYTTSARQSEGHCRTPSTSPRSR